MNNESVARSSQSSRPVASAPERSRALVSAPETTNLADLLERVLDKGIVIAGDITISLGAVELLTLKIRLLIASIDKAREIGINWWQSDPFLSSRSKEQELEGERDLLKERLARLERLLLAPPQEADQEHSKAGPWSNAAPAYVLDRQGRVGAELKQPAEQPQEDEGPQAQERAPQPAEQPQEEERSQAPERAPQSEPAQNPTPASVLDEEGRKVAELKQPGEQPQEEGQPQAQERAPQPEAAQVEQPAGAGPLVGLALQEQIAQALQPVLGQLRQRIAQAPQPVEQGRPEGQRGEEQPQE